MNADEAVTPWLAAQADRVIETSCAFVFLTGKAALKIKKPVDFGFLDFTNLEKRRWALERELAFNRVTAPDIYRRVRRIGRLGDGFAFDGEGETVEWLLEMRRFDPDAVLAEHPERVDGGLAEALGRRIARAHIDAAAAPEGGGTGALGYTIATNADHLRSLAERLGRDQALALVADTDAAFALQAPLLEVRRYQGFARACHGDLHLANILVEDGQVKLFDCIEFNDRLREIDTLYDLAFLLMDFDFRGRGASANRVLNAYLDEAARGLPDGLWDGLAALPLMLAARATVRAHVTAATGDDQTARAYLAAAGAHLRPSPARLIAVGGLSGSGKTTFARALAPLVGASPGAVVLRSDEIRKRLWSVQPLERLPPAAYGPGTSERVYGAMINVAKRLLAAGRAVVLDAVFLAPGEREAAERAARQAGAPFRGVWLEGDPALLEARIASRANDASDADARVLHEQLTCDLGPMKWRRMAAADDLVAAARAMADD